MNFCSKLLCLFITPAAWLQFSVIVLFVGICGRITDKLTFLLMNLFKRGRRGLFIDRHIVFFEDKIPCLIRVCENTTLAQ